MNIRRIFGGSEESCLELEPYWNQTRDPTKPSENLGLDYLDQGENDRI